MAVEHLSTVPHLTTALSGPLLALESVLLDKQGPIEAWLRRQWLSTPAPFYGSVDLRNAGFKLAPVDTNLFPAGFNNLNNDFMPLCVQAAQSAVERVCPKATGIALINATTQSHDSMPSAATKSCNTGAASSSAPASKVVVIVYRQYTAPSRLKTTSTATNIAPFYYWIQPQQTN